MGTFCFKSIADLGRDVRSWLDELPQDLEVVVGVPRSGLLVASLISLLRHIPMTDVDGLLSGRILGGGRRFAAPGDSTFLDQPRRILIVDDSVLTGQQLNRVKAMIEATGTPHAILYGAVYVEPGAESHVDHYWASLPYPRMFEWNLMHHAMLGDACIDIDGVLCRDPTESENDDGPRYRHFIRTVPARVRPAYTVGTLVTARLEKYRAATEEWLGRNGIEYDRLVMMPYATKAERIAAGRHAAFKAEAYAAARASIFLESNRHQAQEIAEITVKPVICTDTMRLCTARILSKGDIWRGIRDAGSLRAKVRWVARRRRPIIAWVKRRRSKFRH